MRIFNRPPQSETEARTRILREAERLFAQRGFDGTTTRDLAQAAGVAEGTLFRHFPNKKSILTEVVTQGWIEILTDLLTELSEMANFRAISKVMHRRMLNMHQNADRLRVCFVEAQLHPDLRDRIQTDVIAKMTDVAEGFFPNSNGSRNLSPHESENCRSGVSGDVCYRGIQPRNDPRTRIIAALPTRNGGRVGGHFSQWSAR
ncbi:TetR/AcrR family transcriptional regulator [Neosynechococcus sphagnicola]|uniref:TetR/AcrR family transcriptional regulator n=1 Tax=Neosynechococcus sphagnicola TaxID=1501145 RepID=UPI000A99C096